MKIIKVTPYSNGNLIEVIAESRRGRRYECIVNRRGAIAINRTFRQETSPDPQYEVWLYVPVPPALRSAAREAARSMNPTAG